MPRKLTIALAIAGVLASAALRVLLNTASALPTLLISIALFVYVIIARNEESEDQSFFKHLASSASSGESSPLEIVFDTANPARKFWSVEPIFDASGKRLPGGVWEYRVEIKNRSSKTLRNVSVASEHVGQMPIRPMDLVFDKTKAKVCDIKPGHSELVSVLRWPIPIRQVGMLAGPTAAEYGPIKLTATADDSLPTTREFDFDYQLEPMLRDRGERPPAPLVSLPPLAPPTPLLPAGIPENWPDVLLQCNWPSLVNTTVHTASQHIVRNRFWGLSAPEGGPVYNVQIEPIDLGGLQVRFRSVGVLTDKTSFVVPQVFDASTELQVITHDLESILLHPPHNADTSRYAKPGNGDQLTADVPLSVLYSDKNGTKYKVSYIFHYDFWREEGHIARVNGIEQVLPEAAQDRQLQESDPQVYVEIDERRTELPSKTIFILRNHGGGIARNVQVEPLTLQTGKAVFPRVDHIAAKQNDEIIPTIEGFGVLQKHHIGHLLHKEWDSGGVATDEFVRPMRIAYQDYAGRKFETTFNLVFHAVRYTIRGNHSQSWPGHQATIFEVRDTTVARIAQSSVPLDKRETSEPLATPEPARRPQLWEALANKFRNLDNKPVPIWVVWIYTIETKQYEWSVRHSSDVVVKMCIELCKEGGRLLLAEPRFQMQFPDVAAVTDDGDRWLLAVYKVAKIGKVSGHGQRSEFGVVQTAEGGEIKDLPGASQVLCQMAVNGF
jgi:hypothetical protein